MSRILPNTGLEFVDMPLEQPPVEVVSAAAAPDPAPSLDMDAVDEPLEREVPPWVFAVLALTVLTLTALLLL